ncbi:ATP-binding protein [Cellulomonas sp. HZM]|uniref:sensor histidine kinase n=1 Tax=Cellulomonas sp. HZM TaxID=1454010 RepID=UPI000492EE77|nr:ATP-binding protein [Cellulomonas sp. HZM]
MSAAPRHGVTLRRRLATLLVVAGAVLGLLLGAAGFAIARLVDRQDAVTQDLYEAVAASDQAFAQLLDAETGFRGFALTAAPRTLEPYDQAATDRASFERVAQDLQGVVHDPRLVALGSQVDDAADAWFAYAEPLVERTREQGKGAVTTSDIETGKEKFDRIRSNVDEFSDELRAARGHVAGELHRWTRVTTAVVALLAVAAVVVAVLLWSALRRWVVEPVDELASDVRIVAQGDLHHPVLATGPGEIAALARDVEHMRITLASQVEEVEQAHAALAEQAEELRRSNRDLEQFAYVASHDLQEPLRKVASFTQLLQKRYGGQLDERADQYIGFAVDGAKRMQRLINDLLGFSRVGRVGGEVTDVDLADALAAAVDNLDTAVTDTGAVVTHGDLPVLRGERALLVQLFQNLVGNAVKFRDPGREPHVHVSAVRVHESGRDAWQIECRDNGIGIDAQYAERVFVIFQRLHPKDVYEGTGIGLALCKKIVEFHGGRIWIEPVDGEGTSIRWTLPDAD